MVEEDVIISVVTFLTSLNRAFNSYTTFRMLYGSISDYFRCCDGVRQGAFNLRSFHSLSMTCMNIILHSTVF